MSALLIRQICLVLHLAGLVLMVGHTVVDFVLFLSFSKKLTMERERSLTILQIMSRLSLLAIAGGVLLIGSGTGLFLVSGGVYGEQTWFQIKMGLIVALILNGSFFGGRLLARLKKLISGSGPDVNPEIKAINSKLKLFYTLQVAIFLTIIVLAVFKIN